MKKIIILFLYLCFGHSMMAQLNVKAFHFRPTGDLGFAMKPTFSAEVGYGNKFEEDERGRYNASLTVIMLKPRLDTFPIVAIKNGSMVIPGFISYKKYNLIQLFAGYDFAFINKEKFHVYGGANLLLGGSSVHYYETIETLIEEEYTGGGVMVGFRLGVGAEYDLSDEFTLSAHIRRSGWYHSEPESLGAGNDFGVGIIYTFY